MRRFLAFLRHIRAIWFVVAIGLAVLVFAVPATSATHDTSIARKIVELCESSEGEAEKELCYEKHVPKLVDTGLTMDRTFDIVRLIQTMDPEYASCHVLAHLITSKEVAKDPSSWKDVVARSPSGICGSGAMHGAFQERFRQESFPEASVSELTDMLSGVCDPRETWQPAHLDLTSCMHGMGHMLLFVTDADIKKAIAVCDMVAVTPSGDLRQSCFEGAFMQLYQPLEPEDFTLVRNIASAAKDTEKFCAQFSGLAYNMCVKESWVAVPGIVDTPATFEAHCKRTTDRQAQLTCTTGLMYAVIETLKYDLPKVEDLCRGIVDPEVRAICWSRTASKFLWADWKNVPLAVRVCRDDVPAESEDACWRELIEYAKQGMRRDSPQTRQLCRALPEEWRNFCAEATETTL